MIFNKLQFALSSVTSWHSVDANFNYILFWQNIVDFFESAPGQAVQTFFTHSTVLD
jgi:hypothetical protein